MTSTSPNIRRPWRRVNFMGSAQGTVRNHTVHPGVTKLPSWIASPITGFPGHDPGLHDADIRPLSCSRQRTQEHTAHHIHSWTSSAASSRMLIPGGERNVWYPVQAETAKRRSTVSLNIGTGRTLQNNT